MTVGHIIAAYFDHPSVFMGGPSRQSLRRADGLIDALKAEGFYIEADSRDIGWAMMKMKLGQRVRRRGWKSDKLWLEMILPQDGEPEIFVHVNGGDGARWLCPQSDVLAMDWELYE